MARRRARQTDVELNLAAMLDMAFQLLTFFILTFRPAPTEGQLDLRLPAAHSLAQGEQIVDRAIVDGAIVDERRPVDPLENLNSLPIRVFADGAGQIGQMSLGDGPVGSLAQLDQRLKQALGEPTTMFDRVVIEASAGLQYQQLMSVMDICSRQTLASGKRLTSLSLAELPLDLRN